MTDYLRLAQQRAPQATEEQDNPYMPLAKQAQEMGQNRARTVIEMALKDDPEIAAERLRLSQSSGLPPDVVQRNLEELRVKERARAVDLVSMAQESPILYRQLVDPTFATTSIDDLDTLKNIERAVGKGVRYVVGADGKGGLPSDAVDAAKTVGLGATVGVGKMAFDMAGVVNDLIGWQSGAQAARGTAKQLQGVMDRYGMQSESSTGQAVKSGLQSAGQNLALLPVGLYRGLYATANAAASTVAGIMSAGVGAAAFNEAREQGRTRAQALTYAIPEAGFEYVFERIPASKLFGDIAANTGLLKMIGRQTVSEGWTEQVTTLAQDFNQWMNLNQDKTLAEFINERPEAAYQTFIATLVGVGVQTSTIRGINKIIESASNQALTFEQDQLAEQMVLASQSLLRQRSPEQFRSHVQKVVDENDGAKKEIYVDGEVLNQLPQELLAQLPESVLAAIPEAVEMRSTVAIPMADVLTLAPGTELEQILNDNARMRPNASSRIEAQMAAELIQQEADRVLAQAADQTVWQQSSEAVRTEILGQLNDTGRFTADVNEAYATLQANFFSTMAARVGVTPQELYQRYTLKVAAKQAGQGGVLNAEGKPFDLSLVEDGNKLREVKIGSTTIVLDVRPDQIKVSSVRTPQAKRGAGSARAAMQLLTQQADAEGVVLSLDASALDNKTSTQKLVDFYKSLGFELTGNTINAVGEPEMVRQPQQQVLDQSYAQQADGLKQEITQAGGEVQDTLPVDALVSSDRVPTITLQDLVGKKVFPTIADRTGAAAMYTGIDSSELSVAIPLLGGPFYPLRESNADAGVVWANRGKAVTGQKAAKLKEGANYMMVVMGDANMHQSNTTVSNAFFGTLEAYVRDKRITKKNADALTKLVRESKNSDPKVGQYMAEFPGLESVKVLDDYLHRISFEARFRLLELLGNKGAQQLGAPSMQRILDATREPSLAGQRWGDGVLVVEVDQTSPMVNLGEDGTQPHPDFPLGIRGKIVGKLQAPVNYELLWADWLAKARQDAIDRGTPENKINTRRAFELSKPIVEVTQELVDRIGPITQANIDGPRQARLAADFAAGNWRTSDKPVNKGGVSPQEFVDAIQNSAAKETLTPYTLDEVKAGIKDGSMKLYQLGDGQVYFMLKTLPDGRKLLASVVNNEQGARGIGAPAVVLKAIEEGATDLDCYAVVNPKFPDGFLPSLYAAFGFEKSGEYAFDFKYFREGLTPKERQRALADAVEYWKESTPGFNPAQGMPALVEMKWKGTDAARANITQRYLRDGLAGLLSGRIGANAEGFAALARASAGATGSEAIPTDAGGVAGDQGTDRGSSVASRARGTVAGIADLNDNELLNLGLTANDRAAVQRALGRLEPDNAVLNQDTLEQGPRGTFNPQTLLVTLNENADLSTFLHESGHFFLEVMADLASQPDAPQQIRDDMAATLKWFGVPDLATWNGYTLDQKRPYHEKWAESFEQYLFEGQAPSIELQPLFRRFRSWLVNVYKSLTQFMRGRNLQVNDEIRQVMGRLIATDEQIAQAEEAAGMLPDFDATNEAIEKLQARSLRDLKWTIKARDKYIKQLTKEANTLRKSVEDEVRKEVEAEPIYRALRFFTKGELDGENQSNKQRKLLDSVAGGSTKLDLDALKEIYGDGPAAPWRYLSVGKNGIAGKDGFHPDMAADMFGFKNGDALVRSILDAESIASVIEGRTDQRMLERHGDLATPEAIADAANEAVHNEARARSLATELKSQAEMMNVREDTGRQASNGRAITVNAIEQAAKQFAANIAARRRVKDLRNAAWQHRSAEARAGKRWQEATAKGETENAVQAKRDQLLNNLTVKALQEAQAEARKILEFFRRVTKDSNEKTVEKGRDPDVVNAMRAILAAYDVAPRLEKSALEYMETVSRNDAAMYGVLKPVVDAALINAKPLPEMTMEELRGLNDELRSMWVLAKRSRQMEVDGDLIEIEAAADELMSRMEEIGIPDQVPGERGAITNREELGLKLQFAKSILSRVEQWAERLDGTFGGPFLRLVFQPVKDAADRYRTDKVGYRTKFTALLKSVAPMLPPGSISAPELGYTFGNARDSGTAELLHALLHTGNDSNKRKLLLGRGWAVENADGTLDTSRWDQFIQRMIAEGRITKAHYDFAQGVWDLLEQMKPLAQETHRKVFGRYFAEVTANEVVTPFGTYRGGYVPAQTDSRLVKDAKLRELAEGENESMAYAFPASPSGFTKSRVEYNKPLLLDLRALAQHMDKVLLFSHMQGAVTDVRRLLTNRRVSYALDRIDPGAYEGMLIPWLNRAAKQVVETPVVGDRKLSRFLSAARSRAGMALMFANLSNTAQQITGFSLAAVKVKPGLMLSAAAQFTADPKALRKAVVEASPYMKNRMLNETAAMNDAVEEILVNPTLLERGQAWTNRHAYFLQAAVDNTMSPIIWTAAYNQAMEQGQNANEAVRFADGVIRQTQGSPLPEDVSRFETGPGYARLFTQFVSYFNMMANTNATAVKQIADEMGMKKGAGKLVYVALAGLLAPIWVAEAIAQAFRGGPEDDEGDGYLDDWLAAVFGFGTVRGLVATVPIVGQAAQLVVNRFNDNPADDKFSLSPAVSLIESAVSSPASVYKAIVDDGNAQKAVRDVAAAATLITGLPVFAAARPIGYLAGTAQGRIDPTGPVDLARGLVTGTASPESRP